MKRVALVVPGLMAAMVTVAGMPTTAAATAPKPAGAARPGGGGAPATAVDFSRDIRPVLSKNCFACHGPDEAQRAAGLRLDLRAAATAVRGSHGAAIVAGAPERSSLLRRITAEDAAGRMPPPTAGHRLEPAQVAAIRTWIQQGAKYSQHWAFVAPVARPLPAVKNKAWVRNGIDAFILAKLEAAGLKPSPEADRFVLLRRASLDLRGLPPTPQEVDAFAKDTSPDAYEKAVDRFLADPAYGERWARMWLDLARYADSAGYGSDPLRLNIWPYRDWVINAYNRNLPYDQFATEQLAGDLLPNATTEQRIATAFHRNTMTNTEGGTDDEEWRVAAVKDRVDTTMQVWMGLTMGCAKCHNHKYEPVSQKEYYQFFGLFNQTADNDQGDERPTMPVPSPAIEEQNRKLDAEIAPVKAQLDAATAAQRPAAELQALKDKLAALEKQRAQPVPLPVMVELPAAQQRQTYLMIKGNFRDRGEKVEPGLPAAFPPLPKDAPLNRLGVAKWLTDPSNPMTARVAVNRYWAQLFGIGLVETEEDFGTQGALPTHPELLDWLAVAFEGQGLGSRVSGIGGNPDLAAGKPGAGSELHPKPYPLTPKLGWDMKALLKLIVTSATYRQSAQVTPEALAKDPRNRLLSHAPRYRLEAEMVRDEALALSGLLSKKMGGPSVYPFQPPGLWQAAFNGQRSWTTSTGEDKYRRGIYTFWRRTVPYPSMAAFDAPSRELCTMRRIRTNTPLQAFVTLNDPVYVEAAQALARRVMNEGGATAESRVRYAIQLCTCRPPSPEQVKQVSALFQSELEHYRGEKQAAISLATEPLGPLPAALDPAEAAAWTVVGNVLLNLDGVITKG